MASRPVDPEDPEATPRLPPDFPSRVPVRESVSIDRLVTDAGTQVRSALDDALVDEYVELLAADVRFPPVVVFRADRDLLADGFHRVRAYQKAGRAEIEADVYPGVLDDALWFALGANRAHGQRLQRDDKHRAVELAYRAWPDLSQVRIAAHVGCTQQYVSRIRAQLTTSCMLPDRVVGSDGRRRPATRRPAKPVSVAEPSVDSSTGRAEVADSALDAVSALAVSPSAAPVPDPVSLDPGASTPVPQPDPAPRVVDEPALPAAASSPTGVVGSSSSDPSPAAPAPVSPVLQSVRDRSNRILSNVVQAAQELTAGEELIHFPSVDRARLGPWIADLEEARRTLDLFITRLRQEITDGSPTSALED